MDGIIVIDKPLGLTSHDVIHKLRKTLKTKRVGHAGTLDPQASGVLIVMVNKATKLSNYLVLDSKEYIATFKLGLATTTQDLEGEVVAEKTYQNDISKEKLLEVLKQYEGKQIQTPSIYSAIKVNGKKLYEYARNNEEVEIPKREIEVYKIELIDFVDDLVTVKVACSSGTYIRSLCYDIAASLNYPGVLTKLRRTKSGYFTIEQACSLEDVENNNYQMISILESLKGLEKVVVDQEVEKDVLNGKTLKIEQEHDFVVVNENDDVLAIYNQSEKGIAKMKRGLW